MEDSMAEMLKEFESMADSPEFQGVLESAFGQLLSRDFLYEPMKELNEKVIATLIFFFFFFFLFEWIINKRYLVP
jgi:peroxin-19